MSVSLGLGGVVSAKVNPQAVKSSQPAPLGTEENLTQKVSLLDRTAKATFNCKQTQSKFTFIVGESGDLFVNNRMKKIVSSFLKKQKNKNLFSCLAQTESGTYYKQYLYSVISDPKTQVPTQGDIDFFLGDSSCQLLKTIVQDFQNVLKPVVEKMDFRDRLWLFDFIKNINKDSSLSLDTKRQWVDGLPVLHDAVGFMKIKQLFGTLKNFSAEDLKLLVSLVSELKKRNPLLVIASLDMEALIFEVKNNPSSTLEDIGTRLNRVAAWKRVEYFFMGLKMHLKDINYTPREEIRQRIAKLFSSLSTESNVLDIVKYLLQLSKKNVLLDSQNGLVNNSVEFDQLTMQNMEQLICLLTDHHIVFDNYADFVSSFTALSKFPLSKIKLIIETLYQFNEGISLKTSSVQRFDRRYFAICIKCLEKIDKDDLDNFLKNVQQAYKEVQNTLDGFDSYISFRAFYKDVYRPLTNFYMTKNSRCTANIISTLSQIVDVAGYEPFSVEMIINNPKSNLRFLYFYRDVYDMSEQKFLDFSQKSVNFCRQSQEYVKILGRDIFMQEMFKILRRYSKFAENFETDFIADHPQVKAMLSTSLKKIEDYKQKIKAQGMDLPENDIQLLESVFLR